MDKKVLFLFLTLLTAACAPVRFVKPLAKKQDAVNVSLGGPLIKYGDNLTIPMPFFTATYGYGIDSTFTCFGALNITSALYGNFQAELGVTKQLIKQHTYFPAVSCTPQLNILYRNPEAKKLYPQLDINAFYEYGNRKNYVYAGVSNWFELSKKKTLDQPQSNHWLFSPLIGHHFTGNKWDINLEIKMIASHLSNENIVVDYQTPFKNKGAFGVYIGFTRKF